MEEIMRVVSRVGRRMGTVRALHAASRVLIALGAFVCAAIVVDKLLFLQQAAWVSMMAAAGIAGAIAVVVIVRGWPVHHRTALEIDERLSLSERISTALAVREQETDFERAVVEDARAYARGIRVSETFPVTMDRAIYVVLALAAMSIALLHWMPQYDLLGRRERIALLAEEQETVQKEAKRMRRHIARIRERTKARRPRLVNEHLERMEEIIKQMEGGELTRGQALAKLSELAEAMKAAQKGMSKKSPIPKDLWRRGDLDLAKKLAEALSKGDFEKAKEELKKLAEKALSQELSPSDQAKLEREMKELAKALKQNPELAKALSQFSRALTEKDFRKLQAAADDLEMQVDELAQLAEEMSILKQLADAAKSGKSGLGEGVPSTSTYQDLYTPEYRGQAGAAQGQGTKPGQGAGMGNRGTGQGGTAEFAPEDVTFDVKKLKGDLRKGRVVGSFFSDGKQIKGDVKVQYAAEVRAAEAEAAEALQQEKIPRAYEEYIREYFHKMKTE